MRSLFIVITYFSTKKKTVIVKEGKDLRCIKRDATESKISKKIDYFSNKIPECLPKNKFISKSKQNSEKKFRNSKSRLNFDIKGIKIKKNQFFLKFWSIFGYLTKKTKKAKKQNKTKQNK